MSTETEQMASPETREEATATAEIILPEIKVEEINWETIGKKQDNYNQVERDRLSELYAQTLTSIAENEVLDGKVVELTQKM